MSDATRQTLSFQYDAAESLGSDGYLTPLYFNRQVLTRYLYDSRFHCEFVSDSYGSVSGEDFQISFGLNSRGSVIAWMGDIQERLPIRERFYWLVENKDPEGDSESEFRQAQLNAVFTDPPLAVRCLNDLAKLNARFHRTFGVHLYLERSIESRIDETRRYRRLILNNLDDLKRFVSELNEIINEQVNNAGLRCLLADRSVSLPSGAKGNKILEAVYSTVLGDALNAIGPFFHLYDLRLWASHAGREADLQRIAAALGQDPDDYLGLLEALLRCIHLSVERLLQVLERGNEPSKT